MQKIKEIQKALQDLIDKHGYWSDEVQKFNNKLDYTIMSKINNLCKK